MAKKNFDLSSMFGELNGRGAAGNTEAEVKPQPTETPVSVDKTFTAQPINAVPVKQPVFQAKQGKQANTQRKKYDYGTKRTFPIPDDLWNDALIVMQAQGLKQVEFINGLIQTCVDENRETINTVKKMRGEL